MEFLDNAATFNTSLMDLFSLKYTKFYDEGKTRFVCKTKKTAVLRTSDGL
jgi:hypothetical protein